MWIINASLHGGVVTVQQGWSVLTHFVYIYHLFTSTKKMRGMFQFYKKILNVVISLSLNDSAHNILNDVLKIVLVSLMVSCVCHPLECNLSNRWHDNVLLEQPSQYLELVFLWLLLSTCCFLVIRVFFFLKDLCHWATARIVVADGFAVLAFLRSLHHSLLMGSFNSKFCSHS